MPVLCRLDDIAEGSARGFSLGSADRRRDIFLVRGRGQVHGYVDSCPHQGTPLAFLPDRYLTRDRGEILCSTHGARFEIATGLCVAGPCRGRALQKLPVSVSNGLILLED